MAAILAWGKQLRLQASVAPDGTKYNEIVGEDAGSTSISWSSVWEVVDLAERHGVPRLHWPIYECDVNDDIPLDEVQARSNTLQDELGRLPDGALHDHWLGFVADLLRRGLSFYVMI